MKMWPVLLYMSKEDSLRCLRQIELEAYSLLVSALRAQGPLTSEKRRVLRDVGRLLGINVERHKSEVRRAVNDEKLNTIAYQLNGPSVNFEDWCHEGRRMLPLLQRISPQTLHPILSENLGFSEARRVSAPIDAKLEDDIDDQPEGELEVVEPQQIRNKFARQESMLGDCPERLERLQSKKFINKNHQKMMLVSNSDNMMHKTISVPVTKVTKLNLEKFKIVPNSFTSGLQVSNLNKNFISTKGGKRIIPLSQLQMLNHKLSSKGGIKVLPISSKIIGKNITMTRINNPGGLKTSNLQPFMSNCEEIPPLSKIEIIKSNKNTQNEEDNEPEERCDKSVEDTGNKENVEDSGGDENQTIDEVRKDEHDDLASLMQIDSSEFIEPEIQGANKTISCNT